MYIQKWAEHVACTGLKKNRFLVGKPEGKRSLGRSRCKWEFMYWIHLAQDRDIGRLLWSWY
jgi:hypothetical protein